MPEAVSRWNGREKSGGKRNGKGLVLSGDCRQAARSAGFENDMKI